MKKIYGLKLVRDFPLIPRKAHSRLPFGPYRSEHDEQQNLIWKDKDIVESLRNAIENNTRNIKKEKYNRIIAEAISGNNFAEDFIKIWKSKNIKKAWRKSFDFPASYVGKVGYYYNIRGGFSKLSKITWIFKSKKEAIDQTSCIYRWGSLTDLVEVIEFNLQTTT